LDVGSECFHRQQLVDIFSGEVHHVYCYTDRVKQLLQLRADLIVLEHLLVHQFAHPSHHKLMQLNFSVVKILYRRYPAKLLPIINEQTGSNSQKSHTPVQLGVALGSAVDPFQSSISEL